ncbi:MAG TPA: nitroreductase family deazaflavin-dependent oxidoreductase [Pseudolysinimonas sp.]|nr:nitroreductase family deazaflavin-dependent oxidoreductase [Pseudolysinimonas sp.]
MPLPRPLRPAVAWFSRTAVFRRAGPRIMPPLERAWRRLGARAPLSNLGVPSLVLHTTGAKSGLPRDSELMYCPDGEDMLITGSNFARETHPAWTANLLQNPDAAVTVRGTRIPVRATLVPAAQRETTWAKLERNWPGYRGYERTAGRELRIFRLRPRR